MQTTPNLGMVIPNADTDAFDELVFSNALVKADAAFGALAYAEQQATINCQAGTGAAPVDLITLAVPPSYDGSTMWAEYWASYTSAAAGVKLAISLWIDGVDAGILLGSLADSVGVFGRRRWSAVAGAHTLKIRGWIVSGAGIAGPAAGAGGVGTLLPSYAKVMKV